MKTTILICLLLASADVAHAGPCPINTLYCNDGQTTSQDSHASVFCRDPLGILGQASASYDLMGGILTSSCTARGDQGASSGLLLFDDFTLMGEAGRCPTGIVANLHVHGHYVRAGALNEGNLAAAIQDMTAGVPPNQLYLLIHVSTVRDTVISWPIHHCVGDIFQMHFELDSGVTLGDYTATAEFSFSGVPQGFAIVSCQGFTTAPVPALPATWGSVRARYR